ncbi:MAG: M1 family aminopeptidase [Planctomycetota bacterium]|nr:M1 family aminopeptidase [Planctomycetota bacterium]
MHRTLITVTAILLVTLPAAAAPTDGPLDATTRDFDQLHMRIIVRPDIAKGTVEGKVTLRFASLADGLSVLRLHCQDTKVKGVKDASGRTLKHRHARNILAIDLPGPLAMGAQSEVTIDYKSTPRHGLLFHRPTERDPDTPLFMYSQGQGTNNRRWIPCYDEPDDRLSWDLTVHVPPGMDSVSNGERVQSVTIPNVEGSMHHWRFADRAPTYLISLIVGELQTITKEHKGVQLDYSAVPGNKEKLEASLRETGNMLDFFGEYLQAPYPWKRYAQTYVWDFLYGGMENVTATTLNMRALHTNAIRPNYSADGLVAHELAHMWFGDLITCRTWQHIWLNEGFATYFTDLFFEWRYGPEEFLLRRRRQNHGYMKGTPKASELKLERDPRGDIPLELFGGKQYSRGAAILHNLRRHLGDEVFREAIRAYVKRHRDSAVTSEDLLTVCEEVAGEDLQWFWDQWVYGLGYPKLDVSVVDYERQIVVRQTQKQAGGQGLFRLRVPIRFGKDGVVRTVTIYRERHTFPLLETEDPLQHLRFGVGGDLLMQVNQVQSFARWGEQVLTDPDVTGRVDAAEALEEFGSVSVPALRKALEEDGSYAVRKVAAEVLGRIDDAAATEALLAGVKDPDPRAREAVFDALGSKNRRAAGAVVLAAVSSERHPRVRAAAARSVGKLKVTGAYDALVALLAVDSDQDAVRTGAVDGLKSLGDVRAVEHVLPFLDYVWGKGGNHRLRQAALGCVTHLKPDDRTLHAVVVELLEDPFHRMRSWAADACGTYKITSAIPRLRHLRDNDWRGGVKGAARQALKRLGWQEPKKKAG